MTREIRIPTDLLCTALERKRVRHLQLFAVAKLLHGHRVRIDQLTEEMDLHPRTGKRIIHDVVTEGWAGSDGINLFPRSWLRLGLSKRRGLYLTDALILSDKKKFEALCFAWALRRLYQRKARTERGSTTPMLSVKYTCEALGISERRCERLRAAAQRYGFIRIRRSYEVLGKRSECQSLRRNIHGPPVFPAGKHTITPAPSTVIFTLDKNGG